MITQEITIKNASAQSIYDVLLDSKKHQKLIGDDADVSATVGEKFSTFGGYATGENLELAAGKRIKQTWRASDWPEGHYSTITFDLSDSADGAVIVFTQEDLPDGTEQEFESGWEDFYWQPLQDYFA